MTIKESRQLCCGNALPAVLFIGMNSICGTAMRLWDHANKIASYWKTPTFQEHTSPGGLGLQSTFSHYGHLPKMDTCNWSLLFEFFSHFFFYNATFLKIHTSLRRSLGAGPKGVCPS